MPILGGRTTVVRRRLLRAWALVAGTLFVLGVAGAAHAGWSTTGTGQGVAAVGTLSAPSGVAASSTGSSVSVTWAAVTPPDGGSLDGYVVTRDSGSGPTGACGTDLAVPGTLVPAGTLSCSDSAVPDGSYQYQVTAVFRSWTAQSGPTAPLTVEAPSQVLTLAPGAQNAALAAGSLFYRPGVNGGFSLRATVTSVQAGAASATFPDPGAPGWSHAGETVVSGTGGPSTTTYESSGYAWSANPAQPGPLTVTGRDGRGATASTTVLMVPDSTGPTGGALVVNGTAAGATPTVSDAGGGYAIDWRDDYGTDAGAGAGSSVLTRETATVSHGVCGAFGGPITLTGSPHQPQGATGCYRFTLTGTDAVGNTSSVSTVVRQDVDAPTQSVALVSPVNAAQTGNLVYLRSVGGSFALESTVADAETGAASATFPGVADAGWTHPSETVTSGTGVGSTRTYPSSTYSFTAGPAVPLGHAVVGTDLAGNTVTTNLGFALDDVAPTGGQLTVNGVAADSAGTVSHSATGSVTVDSRTDFTDADSGIATSTLSRADAALADGACGAFGIETDTVSTTFSGLATGCYRFTLSGTDRVGNLVTLTTTVRVDLLTPTGGALTVGGVAADAAGSTTSGPTNGTVPIDARTDYTDAESGLASSTLVRSSAPYTAGGCGTYTGSSTVTGTAPQTSLTTFCYRFTLTGTDLAGNAASIATVVRHDTTVPVSGAVTVNGTAASTAGTTSFNKTGSVAIGSRTDWTDAASGIATSDLTMAAGVLSNNSCGSFGAPTTVLGTATQTGLTTGCYQFVLTGTDQAGNSKTVSTIVKVDLELPVDGAVTVHGVAADGAGSTVSGPLNGNFLIDSRTEWTDAGSGINTSALTRGSAPYTAGSCGAFTGATAVAGTTAQTGLTTFCYKYTLTGTDRAGNVDSVATVVKHDTTAPTSGAFNLNATAASAGGSTSVNKTGAFTFASRTDYTDAASGIASSVLTVASAPLSGGACGTYGTTTTVAGTTAQSGLGTGCYKYTLTGTDSAGNTASVFTTVKVDLVAPTGAAFSVNGLAATAGGSTSGPTNAPSFPVDSRTDYTDAESGLASSTLSRSSAPYTAGSCGTFTGNVVQAGLPVQSGLATNCWRYILTGTDNAGNTATLTTTVKYDVTAPVTGALTVNGVAASGAGTTSNANGSYAIARTDYTDAASQLASSVLTRSEAPLTGSTCGTFSNLTTLTGNPAQSGLAAGCYLYTLTGTDNAGNIATLSTTVKAGPYVSAVSTVNGVGTAGKVDQGDKLVLTFNEAISVSSICSTWTGNASDQSLSGNNQVTVTLNDNGASNDSVTVSSSACTLNVGTLVLAQLGYATNNVTFGGAGGNASTVAWNAAAKQLTITLGGASGTGAGTITSNQVGTFTPSGSITNLTGLPVGGTASTGSVKQF